MFVSRSRYERYTPAQQELRAIAFSISSDKVIGANYVAGWQHTDPRPTGFAPLSHENYMPVDQRASLTVPDDEDAGWISVPSQRILKRRERAAARRKEREATGGWLGGRGEDVPGASSLIDPSVPLRADWMLRKDGSHELVIR